jgi:hypothetical protein
LSEIKHLFNIILNKNYMKTNKYIFTALGFATGLVSGISIIALLSFANAPVTPPPAGGNVPVSAAVAHTYLTNYLSGAASFNQVIKGFTVDKAQLDAMNSIARENSLLTGFRIYLGKDNNSKKIGIVVGVDNTGKDAVKNTIFNTDSQNLSPCPPVCDVTSPIIID